MIAATARVHQSIVATRNEADFRQLDVRILNPFKTSFLPGRNRLCARSVLEGTNLRAAIVGTRLTADKPAIDRFRIPVDRKQGKNFTSSRP